MPQNNNSQSGNVFIIILIGIVLFGALMFMFSRSAQQGTGNVSKQQAKLAASEILSHARLVEAAVNRLRLNGCSESEISFENALNTGYEHTPVTRDECKIFDEDGGRLSASYVYDDSDPYYETIYIGEGQIEGVGNTCPNASCNDLVMVQRLNAWFADDNNEQGREICAEINTALGLPDDLLTLNSVDDTPSPTVLKFTGDFSYNAVGLINLPDLVGQNSFCHIIPTITPNSAYSFVHVLLAR